MKLLRILLISTICTVPIAVSAGGPVISQEEGLVVDVRTQGDGGSWVVPVIIGAIVACAILCGGGDDTVSAPKPACNGDGGCRK